MDAVTYPNPEVAQHLNETWIPLKLQIDQHKDLARRFGAKWTPGLYWLDSKGVPRHENVGYFMPEELLAECTFARGRVCAGTDDWKGALERFDEVLERWPRSFAAPAALFWSGAAAKMSTGKVDELMARWKRLLSEYSGTAWAMKVSFLQDQR